MEDKDDRKQGLHGESPLILCGNIQGAENDKVGVVSVVYATKKKDLAGQQLHERMTANPDNYYMIYRVPLDIKLTTLAHYSSIAITKRDLQ